MARKKSKSGNKAEQETRMAQAMEAVRQLMAARGDSAEPFKWAPVAAQYRVSKEALRKRWKTAKSTGDTDSPGKLARQQSTVKAGVPTLLNAATELKLKEWVHESARVGMTASKDQLRVKGKLLLAIQNRALGQRKKFPTENGLPGGKWARKFMERHGLVLRSVSHITAARSKADRNWQMTCSWFDQYEEELDKTCTKVLIKGKKRSLTFRECPDRIFNADESGFQPRHSKKPKGVTAKGSAPPQRVGHLNDKQSMTVLPFANALGESLHFLKVKAACLLDTVPLLGC